MYLCSENKGADQLRGYRVTAKLVCAFVFIYAKCWFSGAAAQFDFQFTIQVLLNC